MTRDELHALWKAGKTYSEIGRACGVTKNVVSSRIERYRRLEGEALWPKRMTPIRASHAEKLRRAGASTLPPLASLKA